MSEQPSRYQRSTSGLVGALVVTLMAVAVFVAWRALNRDDLEVDPEPVDYLASVRVLQAQGVSVVYPRQLPSGWVATSAEFRPGRDRSWAVGALTGDSSFAGFRQERDSVERLVAAYVDEDATEEGAVRLDSPLAKSWRTFTDAGGDHALAAEVAGQTVLVYGSAEPDELEGLAERLTRDRLAGPRDAQSS